MKPVHSGQLERWLGREECEHLSLAMRGWYADPIAVAGVPGAVYVGGDGEFYGTLKAGFEVGAVDRLAMSARRFLRGYRRACRVQPVVAAGFSSLLDLMAEARSGKMVTLPFDKTQTTNTESASFSYWLTGVHPTGGYSTITAGTTGTNLTKSSAGAFQTLPLVVSGDQLHFADAWCQNIGGVASILLYDRFWAYDKTMNTTSDDVIYTGNVTRYQSINAGDWDSARGNFISCEATVTLAATAHTSNFTYANQDETYSRTASAVGISGCVANRVDLADATPQWFVNLQSPDTGVKEISTINHSAAVATGQMHYFLGHPIAWMISQHAMLATRIDGLGSSLQLQRVDPEAALALMKIGHISGAQTNTRGAIRLVSG